MSVALAYQLPLEEQPLKDELSEKPHLGKKLRLVHSSDKIALLSDCSTKRKSPIKLRCASAPLHGHVVGVYDQAGNPIQETVWFGSQPVATIKGPNIYYIHSDHLNTPRAITDNNNKVVWSWHSDPFGTTPANEDPDGDGTGFTYNLRFPGQYYDQESGLHYNYFRTYDPSSGRYTRSDPIGLLGGLNTYGYVGGDPLGYRDRYGLNAGAAAGVAIGLCITHPRLCIAAVHAVGTAAATAVVQAVCTLTGYCSEAVDDDSADDVAEPKPDREQKPEGCPTGTKPIDQDKRLDRGKIHDIKDQIDAAPKDWVGIDKDGNIWTNEGGQATNNGPFTDYTN